MFLLSLALFILLLAAFPTAREVMRLGNVVDPLGREIEEENKRRRQGLVDPNEHEDERAA